MDINTKVYIIPYDNFFVNVLMSKLQFIKHGNVVYSISKDELDFPSKTLKELTRELGYNPFEQDGPLTEDQQLLLDINTNLEYLICLADLGLLGGEI